MTQPQLKKSLHMGLAESVSGDCHYQRALITRQITALENECKRLDLKTQAEEQRIIVANRRGASRQELRRHASNIKSIEKERKAMQKVVARLQSISAEFIKVQGTEILNEHLSQLDDVISQVNSQIVIPELKEMRKNSQKLSGKAKIMNDFIDTEMSSSEEEEDNNNEEEDEKTRDAIIDRVLGPSLITRLNAIEVPTTQVQAKNTTSATHGSVHDKKNPDQ